MLEFIGQLLGPAGTVLVIAALIIITGIKILKEYERAVIFRLGRMVAPRGPGITYVIPLVEKMLRVDLRTVTMDVPPQDIITRDNVSVKVSAVLYFRVIDPNRAIREVENYLFATSQLAQVTLRSVCGQAQLAPGEASKASTAARTTGKYSRRHPAMTAFMAASSTVQTRSKCAARAMTSCASRPT